MNYLKKIIAFLFLTFILSFGGLIWYAQNNLDKIITFALDNINSQLNTPLEIEGAKSLDLTHGFPNIAIKLDSAHIGDLFECKELYFLFPVLDIISGKYRIKKVMIKNADISCRVDIEGNNNYVLWKFNRSSDEPLDLDIEEIIIIDSKFKYETPNTSITLSKLNTQLGLFINKGSIDLSIEGDFHNKQLIVNKAYYFREFPFSINGLINYDINNDLLSSDNIKLSFKGDDFDVSGKLHQFTANADLDILISGKKTSFKNMRRIFRGLKFTYLTVFDLTGECEIDVNLKGPINSIKPISVSAGFELINGNGAISMGITDDILVNDFYTKGRYETGNISKTFIDSFRINIFGQSLSGYLNLSGSQDLMLDLFLRGAVKKSYLSKYSSNGNIEIDHINLKTHFNLSKMIPQIKYAAIKGSIKLTDWIYKNGPYSFDKINGTLSFNEDQILIDELKGNLNNEPFSFKGYIPDINKITKKYFSKFKLPEIEKVIGTLTINSFEYSEVYVENEEDIEPFEIEEKPDLDLILNIGRFKYIDMVSSPVSARIKKRAKRISVNDVNVRYLDGMILGNFTVEQSKDLGVHIAGKMSLDQIKLDNIFRDLNDFGQTYIRSEHLKGLIDGNFDFQFRTNEYLKPELSSLKAQGPFNIKNGELIDFEPLKELGDLLNKNKIVNKIIKVKEFDHIKFAEIKNQIELKNKTIYINDLDIYSSAAKVYISGEHKLNNDIDYRIKVNIPSILNKGNKKQEDYIVFDDKGLNLFVTATGNVEEPIIKYDRKKVKQTIKKNIKKEKDIIKDIIKKGAQTDKNNNIDPNVDEEEELEFIDWDNEESDE